MTSSAHVGIEHIQQMKRNIKEYSPHEKIKEEAKQEEEGHKEMVFQTEERKSAIFQSEVQFLNTDYNQSQVSALLIQKDYHSEAFDLKKLIDLNRGKEVYKSVI